MTFRNFLRELNGKRVEGELITALLVALISGFATLALVYFLKLRGMEGFLPKYGLWIVLSTLSYAMVMPAIRQVKAYKEFPCMAGMMIGMTLGMVSSFLPGFYVAANNGMFYGGFFGVVVGMILGIWNGKTCGIMGVMEGMMAAFMGGLMGAMTAFMLVNDHLIWAAYLVFIICAVIMLALNYMIYKETKTTEREIKEDYWTVALVMVILTALTTWFIVYGPRGGIFA